MNLKIVNGNFHLRQSEREQWVLEEVMKYASDLANLTWMPVAIRWGQYDNGKIPPSPTAPRWFVVHWNDTVEECLTAFAAGKSVASGTASVGGPEDWDDDPQPVGYLSPGALTMLAQGRKTVIHPTWDALNCKPVFDQYKPRS